MEIGARKGHGPTKNPFHILNFTFFPPLYDFQQFPLMDLDVIRHFFKGTDIYESVQFKI